MAGLPSIKNRSSRPWRCGEQYKPVRTPEAVSAAASIAAVDPFPLVPATWMICRPTWGSPSRRSRRRIRLEPELPRGPGHPPPLVVQPAVEVLESLLIVV